MPPKVRKLRRAQAEIISPTTLENKEEGDKEEERNQDGLQENPFAVSSVVEPETSKASLAPLINQSPEAAPNVWQSFAHLGEALQMRLYGIWERRRNISRVFSKKMDSLKTPHENFLSPAKPALAEFGKDILSGLFAFLDARVPFFHHLENVAHWLHVPNQIFQCVVFLGMVLSCLFGYSLVILKVLCLSGSVDISLPNGEIREERYFKRLWMFFYLHDFLSRLVWHALTLIFVPGNWEEGYQLLTLICMFFLLYKQRLPTQTSESHLVSENKG